MQDLSLDAGASTPACAHAVHFYDQAYPADAACDFIAAGLREGESCTVLLRAPHRHAVEQRLRALGLHPQARPGQLGSYRSIDTHEALGAMQRDGRIDLAQAHDMLAAMLAPAGHNGARRARTVGDPAPTLLAAGHKDDAVAFEALVDRLVGAFGAKVFCAYPIAELARIGQMQTLFDICAEHRALDFASERLWARGFMAARGVASSAASAAVLGRIQP